MPPGIVDSKKFHLISVYLGFFVQIFLVGLYVFFQHLLLDFPISSLVIG